MEGFKQRLSSRRIVLLGAVRPSLQISVAIDGLEKLVLVQRAKKWHFLLAYHPLGSVMRGRTGNQGNGSLLGSFRSSPLKDPLPRCLPSVMGITIRCSIRELRNYSSPPLVMGSELRQLYRRKDRIPNRSNSVSCRYSSVAELDEIARVCQRGVFCLPRSFLALICSTCWSHRWLRP